MPYLDLVFQRQEPRTAASLLLASFIVANNEGRIDRKRVRRVL